MDIALTIIIFIINLIISVIVALAVSFFRIGQYKNKVDTLETTIGKDEHSGLRKTLANVKTEVDKLLEFKINTQKFIDSKIFETHSPLNLSDFGRELVNESGITKLITDNKKDLSDKFKTQFNPQTKYDVQEKSREFMESLKDYHAFRPVKKYAFDNGKDFGQILRAGAIILRDLYLKEHKEITE